MPDKKPDAVATKNPKKANLLDHHSIKHILDESVSEIVTNRGYVEDVRMSNIRLVMGTIIIVIALVAQFYKKKDLDLLVVIFDLVGLFTPNVHEGSVGSFTSTGLVVSSKLPRFSDMFTKDGVLVEGLFWKDVEALIDQYAREPKKSK
ncbi:putative signal peptidase complex subunit 2 [Quercus suber]|uniref:Signal peptidase complex subunit 2 n=1 Tax=Quercus suber TaxID=58331 RepID=A0AAW0KTS3_QUESU